MLAKTDSPTISTLPPGSARLFGLMGGIAPLLVVLLIWQLTVTSQLLPSEILVGPATVFRSLLALSVNGQLAQALGISLYRLVCGFFVGAASGIGFGLLVATSRWAERMGAGFFGALRQIPVVAFIPMLILTAGVGDGFKIVTVAIAAFFPIALATQDAIRAIPEAHFEVAAVFQLRSTALFTHLLLPASVPGLFTGARVALTRAWMVLVAAELISGDSGIG